MAITKNEIIGILIGVIVYTFFIVCLADGLKKNDAINDLKEKNYRQVYAVINK